MKTFDNFINEAGKGQEFVKFGDKEVMELVYSQSGSKEITLHFNF